MYRYIYITTITSFGDSIYIDKIKTDEGEITKAIF